MSLLDLLKKFRNRYVAYQVKHIRLPSFPEGDTVRKRFVFQGRVQHVGFRREVHLLAERLALTGSARNRKDGSVEVEIQGDSGRILYLVQFMRSLKRANVTHIAEEALPFLSGEKGFTVIE